ETAVAWVGRDEAAVERVRELLLRTGETLRVALDGLFEIRIEMDGTERVLTKESDTCADLATTRHGPDGARTTLWRTVGRSGTFASTLLADRPTEERERTDWFLTWAVPVDKDDGVVPLPASLEPVVQHRKT